MFNKLTRGLTDAALPSEPAERSYVYYSINGLTALRWQRPSPSDWKLFITLQFVEHKFTVS